MIHSGSARKNRRCQPVCHEHTSAVHRRSAAKRKNSPESFRLAASPFNQEAGGFRGQRIPCPFSGTLFQTGKLVSPFVVLRTFVLRLGTTRGAWRNGSRLPCREHRLASASFLLRPHSPSGGFVTGMSPSRHRIPLRRPQEVPALAVDFVRWVTSVEGVSPRVCCRLYRASAPPRFPRRQARFLHPETRSWWIPGQQRSFPVRYRLPKNSPARAFAPFVVELFAARFPETPRLMGPGRACRQARAPHAGQVERAGQGPEPPVQDSHPL